MIFAFVYFYIYRIKFIDFDNRYCHHWTYQCRSLLTLQNLKSFFCAWILWIAHIQRISGFVNCRLLVLTGIFQHCHHMRLAISPSYYLQGNRRSVSLSWRFEMPRFALQRFKYIQDLLHYALIIKIFWVSLSIIFLNIYEFNG